MKITIGKQVTCNQYTTYNVDLDDYTEWAKSEDLDLKEGSAMIEYCYTMLNNNTDYWEDCADTLDTWVEENLEEIFSNEQ